MIDESPKEEAIKNNKPVPELKPEDSIYQRLGKFAEQLCEDRVVEQIEEESWDFKTLQTLFEVTSDKEEWIAVKTIKAHLATKFADNDKKPSSHWIGRYFRRIGLTNKRHFDTGRQYLLSKKTVNKILNRLSVTSVSSESSVSSVVEEEQIEEETQPTLLPCSNCGSTSEPCTHTSKETGKPICKSCNEVFN